MLSRRKPRPARGRDVRRSPYAALARHGVEALETRILLSADVVISEFMASNNATLRDADGDYSDWIELYNRGDAAQNLDGWFLTDNGADPGEWRFPAVSLAPGTYLTVFASGKDRAVAGAELHTNFKLDSGGEYLALVQSDGVTVKQAYAPSYPDQSDDVSYGLSFEKQAGNFEEQYFTQPTPGAANVANAPAPTFSVHGGTFASAFNLVLGTTLPGAEIRYTTNRTVPTATSTLYTGPITVSNSTIVRARAFAAGRTPSPVVSETYLALDASVQNFNSNLPLVVLDTFGGGVAESPQTLVGSVLIDTTTDGRATMLGTPDFTGHAGLNVRGQTSAGFEKKQYHFELWDENNQDRNASLLGMPKDSDWILYAPYSEKTLMQNYLAYMWSNRIGQYAVRTRWVEVFMNSTAGSKIDYAGDYLGVYILMEKIKIDSNRVDIAKLGPNDNAAPGVTGGYIWRKDKPDPGEASFSAGGNDFRYEDPNATDITAAQKTYLTNYLNEFNTVLNGPNFADPVNGYAKYIDVDSWIDHHIIVELCKNIDGFRLSTYYYKDRDGKIKMGPVWDYNLSLGNANYNNGWIPTGWYHDILSDYDYPYWRRLFQDPNFQQKYIDRWQELRKSELSTTQLMSDIDSLTSLLSDGNGNYPVGPNPVQTPTNPVVRNYTKWKVLGANTWPNWYTDPSWINQVNWMKDWLRQRVEWWDSQYLAAPAITPPGGNVTSPTQVTISSTGGQSFVDTSIVPLKAPAKAIVPTADIGTSWLNRTGFDDSGWTGGTTGVGYDLPNPSNPNDFTTGGGDYRPDLGLTLTMQNVSTTAYIRIPFSVANPSTIQTLNLRMKYDDGFVAYLNGTEIARSSNIPATLDWQSATAGNATHNATGFETFDVTQFINLLVPGSQGQNVLAIQALNGGLGSSDLLILPELVSRTATATAAPVYYTTDGTDPRRSDGSISPTAQLYTAAFTVGSTARVMARARLNNQWSGLASQLYDFGENRLRITEIMYNPAPAAGSAYLPDDFEYVELMNAGSQSMNLNGTRFTNGIDFTFGDYTLGAGARVLVVKNQAAFESRYGTGKPIAGTFSGSLGNGGERIRLVGRFGEVIHDFSYSDGWYPQTDGQGWSLTIVDPNGPLPAWNTKSGWRASEPVNGTPGGTDSGLTPNSVVLNEVMTNAASGGDWLELRNTTGAAINIGNWWLSDNATNLKKWRIPAGATVPANGYLVFTESQFGSAFAFNPNGEAAYLSSGDAAGNLGGYRVDETFGASDVGVTFGRVPLSTGGSDFTALLSPTQGAANAAPRVGPVVINEIMYFPGGTKSEYIELRNITGAAVPLYDTADPNATWKFAGAIDWAFPTGVTIPANGYLVVSAVDPATFRSQYNVPAGVQVFGGYTLANGTNVLSNGGESVRLLRPGAAGPVATRPYVQVDKVAYDDDPPWPAETNGTGQSLGRINSGAYGNDPANWAAELFGGSPGRPNLDDTPPTADVVDVAPDPRTTPVASVTIAFNEPVTGFDLADIKVTRDGSAVLFTGAETLASTDGGVTWTLGNLSTLTGAAGAYVLTVVAAGSGIIDDGGRSLAADASDAWVTRSTDTSAPSADIVDINPDPRHTSVPTITIVFSEPVVGFDRSDLSLKRGAGSTELLTNSQTLSTADGGITWALAGLGTITATQGMYTLTLKSSGTGITDLAGNALAGGATEQWVMDTTAPTADVIDVTPDPRGTPVDSITISFSESVTGVDLSDLRLRRNGGPNLLTAAQTVSTPDGGDTWVLANLAGLTASTGDYTVQLVAAGSGVTDAAGNALGALDASDTWSTDAEPPTVDIVDAAPDPRNAPVGSLQFVFSEPVVGLDLRDLQLVRAGDPSNLITAAQTLTTADNGTTWLLDNLAGVTAAEGTYTLTLISGVSGIVDDAGNSLQADATETWTMDTTAPTADVVDVTPDPRNTAVPSITITFSEPVVGFNLADLQLTRQGTAGNLLGAAQTVTSSDGGLTWVLGNLDTITGAEGVYTLTLTAAGSGIADRAGNALAADVNDTWTVDTTPPTVDIVDVVPEVPQEPVDSITIVFSEPVTGFDLSDLALAIGDTVRTLGDPQTLTTTDGITWVLGNLTALIPPGGFYQLDVIATGSGIRDAAGNLLTIGASDTWGESPARAGVFVRGSSWLGDDGNPATTNFKEYLQQNSLGDSTYGYRVYDIASPSNPNDIIPWTNVDEIVIRYSAPPSGSGIPVTGMVLTGVRQNYTVANVQQLDAQTYVLHLDRALGWNPSLTQTNGDKVRLRIPGAGAGGADFSLVMNVVQGDVNKSTSVLANDYSEVKARFFKNTKSPVTGINDYSPFHDVDGSGSILANDYSAVKARFFQNLPSGAPASVASADSPPSLTGTSATKDLFAAAPILA